ncbi:MAG: hypothetical protein QF903_06760 [Planctomycetota bacterium]|jgi:hypothetical protein|nr:hypothetical protein [Planctomycetota bacterium]MDP6762064.1 hypothetical protein [Planctomycetota bacterium]MDP6989163.1 hypothetical protein [Planctomycetota bacterium]
MDLTLRDSVASEPLAGRPASPADPGVGPPGRSRRRALAVAAALALSICLLRLVMAHLPAPAGELALVGWLRVAADHPVRSWLALTLFWAGMAGAEPDPTAGRAHRSGRGLRPEASNRP